VALCAGGEVRHAFTATTKVTLRELDDELLAWYLATGEWEGRAGGYAIQGHGAALVRAIDGDYTNVVGLPVAELVDRWPDLLRLAR
jgi:septum formation protein